ncbi:MAG: hypothetical protein COA79_07540 [Planctomycetota bacterium]|nr:MAG: hypothetical protein COA79_07540 [Planctomycetota bacterium]
MLVGKQFFFLLIFLVSSLFIYSAELILLDGSVHKGDVSFKDNFFVVKGKAFPIGTVLEIKLSKGFPQKLESQHRIFTIDGSCFLGAVKTGSDSKIKVWDVESQPYEIQLSKVHAISFKEIKKNVTYRSPVNNNYIVMVHGKVIKCDLEFFTFVNVGVKVGKNSLKLKKSLINRLNLRPKTKINPDHNIILKSRYGDSIYGKLLKLGLNIEIETVLGTKVFDSSDVLSLELVSDSIKYLNDLKPTKIETVPYLDMIQKPTFNQGLFGGSVKIRKKRYNTGICMQSRTTITYNIEKKYSRFEAEIALDIANAFSGNADFIVLGDGKLLYKKNVSLKYTMIKVDVPIKGVTNLSLKLDYGKNGSSGDFGIWGSPRLIK